MYSTRTSTKETEFEPVGRLNSFRAPRYSLETSQRYRIYTKYVESPIYDGGCKSSDNCCKNCTTERKQHAYRYRDYSTDGPSCNDSNWETDRVLVRSGTYDLVWFIGHVSDCDPATSPGCQPAD